MQRSFPERSWMAPAASVMTSARSPRRFQRYAQWQQHDLDPESEFYALFVDRVIYAAARDLSGNNSGWQTMGVHAVPPIPSSFKNAVGMRPSSGSEVSQTITFTYQDQTDATNLQTVWALFNTAVDGRGACYVAYYRPGNLLLLFPDDGDGSQAASIPLTDDNVVSNSQCTISARGSSVQTNGNSLSLTLPVTFHSSFAGFRGVWMAAYTMDGRVSLWQALGAWAVPGQ
jgi:hypothetical protein